MCQYGDISETKDLGHSRSHLLNISSADNQCFVSAQDTVADLADFEDLVMMQGDFSAKVIPEVFVAWMSNWGSVTNRQHRPCTGTVCSDLGPPGTLRCSLQDFENPLRWL